MEKISKIIIALALPLMVACNIVAEDPSFAIDQRNVISLAHKMIGEADSLHYADQWIAAAVANDTCSLWIGRYGMVSSADTLLAHLQTVGDEGLSRDFFRVEYLQTSVDSVNSWARNGRYDMLNDTTAAEIEAALTQAFLRYAYAQRYGLVKPHDLHNHLLKDADAPEGQKDRYRQLYDIPCDQPTDSLSRVAIERLRHDDIGGFLRSIQPDNSLHPLYVQEYKRAIGAADTAAAIRAIVNMERSHWRYARPDTGRYVFVNLAAQTLWAVDQSTDTCIDMRICCGNLAHKSPMLTSHISYLELDPYWVVPMSIIRNETVKLHLGDSSWFARNNMIVTNNNTGETVNPANLTAKQWTSGVYTMKQDKGAGNSLGRMIFRFPNKFAVYLHDTNSPGAFNRDRRTVSHGCIRVQKPMALASFLLSPDATPLYIDRVRMSIDLPPLTAEGRRLKEKEPKPLKRCDFKPAVPLWIDYYTLYPDRQGKLCDYPDIYSYDAAIAEVLRPYCAMQ